ncbi:MEG10 protein, partial [Chaetorhynchus papuensis]|nr:MEG10 protein [Chaetorhynchus papuensis]
CHHATGECSCPPGWTGHGCEHRNSGRWGQGCARSCDPATGTCSCQPGFTRERCQ